MSLPRPHWRPAAVTLPLIAALAVTGCSDEPLAPRSAPPLHPVVSLEASAGAVAEPETFSNHQKYRDNSVRNATGRDGSAVLTARALLGNDGMVDLEVTTGTFDGQGTPPGNLDKVQVKGLSRDSGDVLWTLNHARLKAGGYWSARYGGLSRGSQLQVQSNVSGIDPDRVGIVTVTEASKLRPDLAVVGIVATGSAIPNVPVNISATVRELNGDVGAWGNCVLAVDGSEVDRANGIWVDAGGTVTCAFTHVFTSAGTRRLTVSVDEVKPGDWDTANNTLSRQITIRHPQDFHYSASVEDVAYHRSASFSGDITWRRTSGETGFRRWSTMYEETGRVQATHHGGHMAAETPFPLTRLDISHATGGSTIIRLWAQNVTADWGWQYSDGQYSSRYSCASRRAFSPSRGRFSVQLCSGHQSMEGRSYSWTDFNHWRWAGDVTYRSRGYEHVRYPDYWSGEPVEYRYEWNYDFRIVAGVPLLPLGSTYDMEFSVTGADGRTYRSSAAVELQRVEWAYGIPETCRDASWQWGDYSETGRSCSRYSDSRKGVAGWTWGTATMTP